MRIKRGDLEPPITMALTSDGAPIDITAAGNDVRVLVRLRGSDAAAVVGTVGAGLTITDAATGALSYAWQAGDTDEAGEYRVEVEVTWPGVRPQTFPGGGWGALTIVEDLG